MRGETNARVVGPQAGRPLILSNALGATAEMWEPQLPAFADLRVVLYDHSPRSSIADLGRDVIALVDRFALRSFSFCGLSLGGMVGMWLAVNAPDRVDRLIVACSSARFGERREWLERAALVRSEGMSAVAYDALEKWFTADFRDRDRYLRMQLAMTPEDYALGLEAIGAFDFRSALKGITAPTLVLAGAEDAAIPPADAALIAEGVSRAELVVIGRAAHLANVEQPEIFSTAVLSHLDGP